MLSLYILKTCSSNQLFVRGSKTKTKFSKNWSIFWQNYDHCFNEMCHKQRRFMTSFLSLDKFYLKSRPKNKDGVIMKFYLSNLLPLKNFRPGLTFDNNNPSTISKKTDDIIVIKFYQIYLSCFSEIKVVH